MTKSVKRDHQVGGFRRPRSHVWSVYLGSPPGFFIYLLCGSSSAAAGRSAAAHLTSILAVSSFARIFVPEECFALPFISPCLILNRKSDA